MGENRPRSHIAAHLHHLISYVRADVSVNQWKSKVRLVRSQSLEADALSGLRKSARAQRQREGLLPLPISLGGRASALIAEEYDAVTAARASGADDEAIRRLVAELHAKRLTLAKPGKAA